MNKIMLVFYVTCVACVGFAQAEETPAVCRLLPDHKISEDVTYQPGVDVRGKPVASADLNAAAFQTPDVIRIPLTVDIVERARDRTGQFIGVESEGGLGMLEIHKDGRVTYNDQDWSSPIYVLCGKTPPVPEDGQQSADVIRSDAPVQKTQEIQPVQAVPSQDSNILEGGAYREDRYR